MAALLETLLAVGGLLVLGVSVWVLVEHLLTVNVTSAIHHPVKFRILHFFFLLLMRWGSILEKLGICSLCQIIRFAQVLTIGKKDPTVVVTDQSFGTIPVRLFQPKAVAPGPRRGIIFYHGGGFLFGNLDIYHNICSFIARETGSVLLSVGYRKLPDYHYPVSVHDCLNATIHFLKALETYGVDPSRVVICGESSGGGTVAVVTQRLQERLDLPKVQAQVLIYPVIQLINFQLPSHQQNRNVLFLSLDLMMLCVCKYLAIDLSWKDSILKGTCIHPDAWEKYKKFFSSDNIPKRFKSKYQEPEFPGPFNKAASLETKHIWDIDHAPLLADDKIIAQLPQAFLVSCEWDVIRDDALLYKKRLEDQGVPVTWHHVEDGFHGCIHFFDKKPFSFPCSQSIMNAVVSYIKGI